MCASNDHKIILTVRQFDRDNTNMLKKFRVREKSLYLSSGFSAL